MRSVVGVQAQDSGCGVFFRPLRCAHHRHCRPPGVHGDSVLQLRVAGAQSAMSVSSAEMHVPACVVARARCRISAPCPFTRACRSYVRCHPRRMGSQARSRYRCRWATRAGGPRMAFHTPSRTSHVRPCTHMCPSLDAGTIGVPSSAWPRTQDAHELQASSMSSPQQASPASP